MREEGEGRGGDAGGRRGKRSRCGRKKREEVWDTSSFVIWVES
jgi:hypothetical protein